ncbi:MAG: hypothetical protein AAF388_01160 [Bacteroidota bacterium]
MMKNIYLFLICFLLSSTAFSQSTYFSIQNGEWDEPTTWDILSNGQLIPAATTPNSDDSVVIRHEVTHNIGANQGYIHTGNIRIEREPSQTGIYNVITSNASSDPYTFGGELMEVFGILTSSSDFNHQLDQDSTAAVPNNGVIIFYEEAIVNIGDDLIIRGRARTEFRNLACGDGVTFDDLYVRGRGKGTFLCGSGRFRIPHQIRVWNTSFPFNELTSPANNSDTAPGVEPGSQAEVVLKSQMCEGFAFFGANNGNCDTCTDPDNCCDVADVCCKDANCQPPVSLPVELSHFDAEIINDAVKLSWITASEVQNDYFQLEKADDTGEFAPLANLKGNGTTTTSSFYEFIDPSPSTGRNLYRLKQVDFDGAFSFSRIITASFQVSKPEISVFPHPVLDQSQIDVLGFLRGEAVLIMVENLLGQTIISKQITVGTNGAASLSLSNEVGAGTYLIRASSQAIRLHKKVVIQ